ncbi:hypothetical protein SLA2020_480330 [Shorea laevis]
MQKVRRRIRRTALAHHMKLQPDPRFSLLQAFHPTQRALNDPATVSSLPPVNHAPGTPVTQLSNSPSNITEQYSLDDNDERALVAGPWLPPSPT